MIGDQTLTSKVQRELSSCGQHNIIYGGTCPVLRREHQISDFMGLHGADRKTESPTTGEGVAELAEDRRSALKREQRVLTGKLAKAYQAFAKLGPWQPS